MCYFSSLQGIRPKRVFTSVYILCTPVKLHIYTSGHCPAAEAIVHASSFWQIRDAQVLWNPFFDFLCKNLRHPSIQNHIPIIL